ncbi:hypothetical protein QJS66_09520 [Kocuria rhizophila]|nr:hypothetical protein QJS66_09520 [Kocuria rhizophila]
MDALRGPAAGVPGRGLQPHSQRRQDQRAYCWRGLRGPRVLPARPARRVRGRRRAAGTPWTLPSRRWCAWHWTPCGTGSPSAAWTASASTWRRAGGADHQFTRNHPFFVAVAASPCCRACG